MVSFISVCQHPPAPEAIWSPSVECNYFCVETWFKLDTGSSSKWNSVRNNLKGQRFFKAQSYFVIFPLLNLTSSAYNRCQLQQFRTTRHNLSLLTPTLLSPPPSDNFIQRVNPLPAPTLYLANLNNTLHRPLLLGLCRGILGSLFWTHVDISEC